MDYTAIGETVNLAYHLNLLAEPGTILVSPETYQRTRPLFEFKALPPLIEDGLAEMDDTGLRITPKGRYFVRNVAMTMDAYLDKGKAIFSKTV